MKHYFLILLAGACMLLHTTFATADYLRTTRKTSIKSEPSSESTALLQVEAETELILLDDGAQTNGYYHISSPLLTEDGWIYRTFVRRYPGNPTISVPSASNSNEKVEVRIVDVGAGQCNLIKLPGNRYVIYDAGTWEGKGDRTLKQIENYIDAGSVIELMVLSHTDGDHIGAAENIIRAYKVKKVLWTGYEKTMLSKKEKSTDAFKRFKKVIDNPPYPIENINLNKRDSIVTPGTKLKFGNATLTFICGFGKPQPDWPMKSDGERLNSVSIMMKLDFKGNSVLFCGDAVGRHIGDPENALIATEKFAVEKAGSLLPSTLIIAPHHGADNGSSNEFIKTVGPEVVIFSSGHDHNHPTEAAAKRYIKNGIDINNMFRTDRGDDERSPGKSYFEWPHLRIDDCTDRYNDDNIQIELLPNNQYRVYYLEPNESCDPVQ